MMKVKSIHIAISIALLSMTFVSCNEETLYDGPCKVRFVAEIQDEVSVTRANDNEYSSFTRSAGFNAELFVSYETTTGTPTAPGYNVSWNGSVLSTSLALETGAYKFYGYAPQQNSASFDNSYKILTIPYVPGLSNTDFLVINPCSATVTSQDLLSGEKAVSLQMNHMMAKVTPCFSINDTYAQIRDIRIKKVEFILNDAATYTATVTYTDYSYTTSWEASTTTTSDTVALYENANATETNNLINAHVAHGSCYIVPSQSVSNLKMKVTYDVFDKEGELVRQGKAENTIKKLSGLTAGKNYKLNIQIIPTYLYVLSDNDESSLVIPNN